MGVLQLKSCLWLRISPFFTYAHGPVDKAGVLTEAKLATPLTPHNPESQEELILAQTEAAKQLCCEAAVILSEEYWTG